MSGGLKHNVHDDKNKRNDVRTLLIAVPNLPKSKAKFDTFFKLKIKSKKTNKQKKITTMGGLKPTAEILKSLIIVKSIKTKLATLAARPMKITQKGKKPQQ